MRIAEPRRKYATRTEVHLAFRVEPAGAGCTVQGTGCRWQLAAPFDEFLFAFLPVRRVGLRFVCSADWLLVSSREDVHDCLWNGWLRDRIVEAFAQVVRCRCTVVGA